MTVSHDSNTDHRKDGEYLNKHAQTFDLQHTFAWTWANENLKQSISDIDNVIPIPKNCILLSVSEGHSSYCSGSTAYSKDFCIS